ncbi:MAG: T9SS type A sorting domain-containing protein [Candidatus Marinimicrobia bacterium]|nr:T9SS type A sorting domain-containing protein [Candidatus Neomarinimicrobiota bacterium]MCF7829341.1 T9SS type A sorting domain-containing protein [Candidatus Neomarinimicrobiota bacterium]MCF7879997.1 T9SS type A sorting domain-containing protein [Candidatus Neomarinimicrobiota bacterium]
MKTIFCTVSIVLLFAGGLFAGTYSGGSGISGDPYQIATTDDLIELSKTSNSDDWDKHFIQTVDISFNADETQVDWDGDGNLEHGTDGDDTYGFLPIGSTSTDFTGKYDGSGYTIDSLYINRSSEDEIALFSDANGATITNVGVTNVDITGQNYVGGLVGRQDGGTVSSSYTSGSVHGEDHGYDFYGLYVGGIIGDSNGGTISNSYSTASVSGYGSIGGLLGNNSYGTISKCYAAGSVGGTADTGGLVGSSTASEVNYSFWDTQTTGESSSSGGGTGKTTSDMKTESTFTSAGWDFEGETANGTNDYWDIDGTTNNGYPFLMAPNQPSYSDGSGTSGDPYLISSVSDLIGLSHYSDHWGKHFKQTADISFNTDETQVDWDGDGSADGSGTSGFSPIGNSDTYFTGNYDGQNYTINNLFINRPSTNNIGLFGYAEMNTINNLGLINVDITGDDDVGALIGDATSSVSNCYSMGQISGYSDVGGLIGISTAYSISKCYSSCAVTGSSLYIGGLVGYSTTPISNCYSTGNVDGDNNVGGLVGQNNNEISKSYSTGNVTGNTDVGGLVGDNVSSVINSFWDTETSGQPGDDDGVGNQIRTESNVYGKTTSEMKTLATFTDVSTAGLDTAWDFETNPNDDMGNNDYWDIDNSQSINNGYPFLSWENGEDVSLPVELASFTGEYAKGSMQLTWVTESEIRNQGFILERWNVQNEAWQEIASFKTDAALRGQGSTSKRSVYTFTDHSVKTGQEYSYRLTDVSYAGEVKVHDDLVLQVIATPTAPSVFRVQTPYPNPFNPTTTIVYSLPAEAPVRIAVYNITGQLVNVVYHQTQTAGNHQMSLSLPDYASGAYFLRISTPEHQQTRKLLLMK